MNKKISVIVAIYNVEKFLDKCIDSISNQSYSNIEIILVNDGSTDNSKKICDKWAKKDSRIKIINKSNGGLSDARNIGIRNSNGEYICFIDGDDYIDKDMVSKMFRAIDENEAEISICNRYHVFENGNKFIKFEQKEKNIIMNSEEAIFQMNSFKSFDMSACTKMFKRKLFENIEFPKGKISEDFYVMYKLFDKANKIVSISDPLYFYYQRNGSITKNKKFNYDFIRAAYEQCMFVEKKYPNLKDCVRTAYASANMTSYNSMINFKAKVPQKIQKELRSNVKENYKYIKENKDIKKIKKVQAFLFIYNIGFYNLIYKIYKFKEKNFGM